MMNISSTIKNLIIRAISGTVLVAVLVSSILYSSLTSAILLSLIAILSIYELLKLISMKDTKPLVCYNVIAAIAISIACYLDTVLPAVILVAISRIIIGVFRKSSSPLTDISLEFFSLIYLLFPMLLLSKMEGSMVVALLVMVWCNDIGAYLVGITIGKHQLYPRLSPKKSWEGFFGGLICTIIVGALIGSKIFEQSSISWGIMAAIVSLAAVAGDLFESMFKRVLGIKDSGNIIPGHGGMLDRFDALFVAAPLFYIIYNYVIK